MGFPQPYVRRILVAECKVLSTSSVAENTKLNPWGRIVKADLELEARYLPLSTVAMNMAIPYGEGRRNERYVVGDYGALRILPDWTLPDDEVSDQILDRTTLIVLASSLEPDEGRPLRLYGLPLHPVFDAKFVRTGYFTFDVGSNFEKSTSNLGMFQDASFKRFHIV